MEELPELIKAPSKDSFGALLGKTLLIFVALAAVAAFVSWSFGWVAVETYDHSELFSKIVSGRPEVKRMAAVEWSRQISKAEARDARALQDVRPSADESRLLGQELIFQSENGPNADVVYAGALATLLSYSVDQAAALELVKKAAITFEQKGPAESWLYPLLALARLDAAQDPVIEAFFLRAARHNEASLRKASVLGLSRAAHQGSVSLSADAVRQLHLLLEDEQEDVRWNAAFALARRQDLAAKPVLGRLLSEVEGANEKVMRDEILLEIVRSVRELDDAELKGRLEKISENRSHFRLRHMIEQ